MIEKTQKNHTQTLNTKTHRLMKSHGKQYNHTPTYQRAWEVRHNLPVNAETHSGGNDVPSREKVSSSEGRTEGIFFREFRIMGLLVQCVLCFDGFVVGG